jgi:hypothetical protein
MRSGVTIERNDAQCGLILHGLAKEILVQGLKVGFRLPRIEYPFC